MPWVFYYPGPVTYAMAGVATGTAIARIQRQKHWLTDVLGAAAISTFMSHYLVRRHQNGQAPIVDVSTVGSNFSITVNIQL